MSSSISSASGKDRDCTRRCVNSTLTFGRWYTLYAVHTGLELKGAVNGLTADEGDDFFETTSIAHRFGQSFYPPPLLLGVADVHSEQIGRKKCRLFATRAGANLDDDILFVIGIFRKKKNAKLST